MEYEALEKLEKAMEKGELSKYLLCDSEEYMLSSYFEPNFSKMNDYLALVYALNDYGKIHLDFPSVLHNTILECLKNANVGVVYNILNIVRNQLLLERNKENSINFLSKDIYENLRSAILANYDMLKNCKLYEGERKQNGLADVIEKWNDDIYRTTGNKIL